MNRRRTIARGGIGIFAALLLALPLLVTEVDARGKGGGGGFGGGAHIGGGGGGGVRSFSVARVGGSGVRSFSATRVTTRSFAPSVARSAPFKISPAVGGGTHLVGGASRTFATAGAVSRVAGPARPVGFARPAGFARVHAAFGNRFIANNTFKSAFVRAPVFHGRFQGSHWPWWRGGIVIGWIGPVFWPYASYDFFDYVYWPYAYDGFWPYAYEDVYYGIYGGYGYVDPAVRAGRSAASPRGQGGGPAAAASSQPQASSICGEPVPQLTDWPIERITEAVEPNDAQRAALDELKAATAQSIDILKSACPNDLPSIPTGRLDAMKIRLQVMLQAVQTVRPPLERFYQLLNDEQKARFNAVSPNETAAAGKDQRDLTRLCTERGPGVADLPIERIAQAVRPTEAQQASLDELRVASAKASETLKTNCPTYQALTPTGRVEAMEKRLEAMLEAVKTVQPALTKFYDGLTDEQKARFNTLGSLRQGA
jgi:hypothetical protein